MESRARKDDGSCSSSGLVPDVLGQVGAGASPSVLPVQREGGLTDDYHDVLEARHEAAAAPTTNELPKQEVPADEPSKWPRIYKDSNGNPVSLDKLVRDEPEWAANQIRHRDTVEKQRDAVGKAAAEYAAATEKKLDEARAESARLQTQLTESRQEVTCLHAKAKEQRARVFDVLRAGNKHFAEARAEAARLREALEKIHGLCQLTCVSFKEQSFTATRIAQEALAAVKEEAK
jgi:hypothetical protein